MKWARALALVIVGGCQRDPGPDARPAAPAGVELRRESDDASHWEREGFIHVPAPIRAPTSLDGRVRIAVLVRVPDGDLVTATTRGGRAFLRFPLGTRAVRVEYAAAEGRSADAALTSGDRVLDVRGTSLAASGRRFHVMRPSRGALLGMDWPDEAAAQARVDEALSRWAEAGVFGTKGDAPLGERLRQLNACAGCHERDRSERPHGLVKRPSDADGFFQLSALFWEDGPFETYRPRDANASDPFVERRCGATTVPRAVPLCSDGSPPTGHLRLSEALASGDEHARAVCSSRLRLARSFDAVARDTLLPALEVCGMAAPPSMPAPARASSVTPR